MPLSVTEQSLFFDNYLVTVENPVSGRRGFEVLDNVWVDPNDIGSISVVPGYTEVTDVTGPQPSGEFITIGQYRSSDGNWIVRFVVERGATTNTVWELGADASLTSIVSFSKHDTSYSTLRPSHASMDDYIHFYDGQVTPFKVTIDNSPTNSDIGVDRVDVTNGSSTIAGSGRVNGTVKYFVAGMSGTTEGALSEAFGEIDAEGEGKFTDSSSGSEISVDVPVGSTGEVRLYRTFANSEQPYFLAHVSGTPDTEVSYNDSVPDPELGDLPFLHGDPPPATISSVVSHYNRIFGLSGNDLYFSDLGNSESFFTTSNGNVVRVFGDDGDFGTALARTPDGILIFKNDHLYRLLGRSPEQFFLQEATVSDPSNKTVGTPSINSLVAARSGIFFYYNKAIYKYFSGTVRKISKDIEKDLQGIGRDHEYVGVNMGYWSEDGLVFISVPLNDSDEPSHTYIYDEEANEWLGRLDVGFNDFAEIQDDNQIVKFWMLDSSSPKIYEWDNGTDFDGTSISSEAQLPIFFGDSPHTLKRFLYLDIYFEPQSSGNMTVEVVFDGTESTKKSYSFDMTGTDLTEKKRVNLGYYGRELIVRIKGSSPWKVHNAICGFQDVGSISQ